MNQTTDAIAIFGPLWKRKWVILAVGILVAAGTYLYYKQATKVYLAETKLYLGAGAEEPGGSERGGGKSGKVNAAEQATIVNSIVAEEVRKRLRAQGRSGILHGAKVRAKAAEKSLFINISAEAHTARGAALLANAAAQGYVRRQVSSHARAIRTQLAITRRQLARIEAASATQAAQRGSKSGAKGSSGSSSGPTSTANILQIANLNSHINELESQLGSSSARQLNPAKPELARLIAPTPRKNAIFGFLIGIVLASIGAYLVDRLDRRLRSLAGMEEVFGTQILTALPKVKRPIVSREGRPAPSRRLLEALRRLHTTLSLGPILKREGAPGGLILFLSPDPGDGKSTLVADLAIVQRDAGARVLVLDANLRRPAQAKLLATDATQGLADVLTGTRVLEEVLQPVMPALQPPGGESRSSAASPATVTELRTGGSLTLLAGGQALANPPAMLASEAMADLLRELADEFDVVLIDASSPIEVSDPMPLLALVSGVIVIGRVGHTREASAQRLAQMLHNDSFAPTLGIVANCASPKDIERYGLSTSRNGRVWGVKLTER
jgi:succinoglycan biosynthesis transport protein ExoP